MNREQLPEIESDDFESELAKMATDENFVRVMAEIAREFRDTEGDGLQRT